MNIISAIRRVVLLSALAVAALVPSGSYADLIAPQPSGWCASTQKAAFLSWSSVSGALSYSIFRSTTTTFSWNNRIARTTSTSYFDTTAVCGKTYYYWVCPSDSTYTYAKKTAYVKVVMTGGKCDCDDLRPKPTATVNSSTPYVFLSWAAPACYDVVKYGIYRGTSSTFSWSTCSRVGTTTSLSYYDYSVQACKTYYYWIATDDGQYWTVTKSRYASATIPCTIPAPQAYGSADTNGKYAYVYWTKVSDSRVVNYAVYRGTSPTFSWSTCTRLNSTTGSSFYDYSVQAGKTYYYWVASGSSSKWYISPTKYKAITIPIPVPDPPQPTASVNGYTDYVRITWPAVSGCTYGYAIFRSTTSTFSWSLPRLTITYNTYYNDTTATPGVKYYYWVCPRNKDYTYANKTKWASGIRSLTAPYVYGYSTGSGNYLYWSSVSGCTYGYAVFRSTTPTFSWNKRIAIAYGTSYTDTTAVKGQTYYYWICPRTKDYTYANSARYKAVTRSY